MEGPPLTALPTRPAARPTSDYVELRTRSAFSFLEGASEPEALIEEAARLGHSAIALGDLDGVYGSPRFHQAAVRAGLRAIQGARITVEAPDPARGQLLLLVESARGWRSLSRLITLGHADRPKGESQLSWQQLEDGASDLCVLLQGDAQLSPELLDRSKAIFPGRVFVDVSRQLERRLEFASRRASQMAEAAGVPIVASGDVRCAKPDDRPLLDALTCLHWKTHLDTAGRRLLPNGERHLHSAAEMAERFADRPEWIRNTRRVAERCEFTLEKLGYRFPEYPTQAGESQPACLRRLSWKGAKARYGDPLPARARSQIEHELKVIEGLDLAGYFLIVHDIVEFARRRKILAQGRGSAANSAVCYSLGITAVDPVGMELLFERFLSDERGEWPDIDIDLPSGDQRESVIQYVFDKYGPHGAAMTANVITYRSRMAVREMGKVTGMAPDQIDRLAKLVASLGHRDDLDELAATLREAGVDADAPRVRRLLELVDRVQGLPRHLGQHSGGIVIAAGRLDEVVPIEPARMQDRRVVQWDKEDCADLGIIKIDLLGLGMLAALENTIPMIREHEGIAVDLAQLPPDDPATYEMIRRADSVGTFQIESRAQMATLPRMKPERFYDLVVEIAIIRPGPIVGRMVHPYLNRRAGREEVTYPHPSLEPILKRTLGIPIFQEQLLRIAMTAAGFSGGEAEELRRAMGFKRSMERMVSIEARLRSGMQERGFSEKAQEDIIRHIASFALYGFPESHSASFALIAYASAYLKRHHPAAFLAGLLNAYPMGFYTPASLIQDAQRHGVTVLPIDASHSDWLCTLESRNALVDASEKPSVRVGLRYAHGLGQETGKRLMQARAKSAFADLSDLIRRVPFKRAELDTLAELGALASLQGAAPKRRAALWQVAAVERDSTSLFAGQLPGQDGTSKVADASPLPEMNELESTLSDYRLSGLTTGPQLLAHMRKSLRERGLLDASQMKEVPNGKYVRTAGHVIVRQRPGSAKGFLFLSLEDETGISNAVLTPDQFKRFRAPLHTAAVIEIAGPVQNVDGVVHLKVKELVPLRMRGDTPGSHDYTRRSR